MLPKITALVARGRLQHKEANNAGAFKDLREAVVLLGDDPATAAKRVQLLKEQAKVLQDLNKPDYSQATLNEAIALQPGQPALALQLAKSLEKQGKYAEAEALYVQVKTQDPNSSVGLPLAYLAEKQNRMADALKGYSEIAATSQISMEKYSALVGIGRIQHQQRRYVAAYNSFSLAVSIVPESSDAYLGKGYAERKLGRTCPAVQSWKTYISIEPNGNDRKVIEKWMRRFPNCK